MDGTGSCQRKSDRVRKMRRNHSGRNVYPGTKRLLFQFIYCTVTLCLCVIFHVCHLFSLAVSVQEALAFYLLLRQSGVQKNTFITRQTANGRFTPGFTYNSMPLDLHVQLDAANPRRYLIGRLADEKDRWMHKACGPCESR